MVWFVGVLIRGIRIGIRVGIGVGVGGERGMDVERGDEEDGCADGEMGIEDENLGLTRDWGGRWVGTAETGEKTKEKEKEKKNQSNYHSLPPFFL